jgi:hypothetical protein
MKRSDLRLMIQQEISKMKEDLLVSPEDVPDDFKRSSSVDISKSSCDSNNPGSYEDPPADHDYSIPKSMRLSCASCGGPLVMEGGCGCNAGASTIMPDFGLEVAEPQHHQKEASYMAKSQLHKIKKYSEKLQHMIPEDYELDDWMRSHISQASDDIGEVYHKLEYMFSKE